MQIVVLGMHRSGTSLVTRVLHELGCHVGAVDWEKGHFEQAEVIAINDALLAGAGDYRWFDADPASFPAHEECGTELIGRIEAVVQALNTDRPWVLKDPRLCVTLPWWKAHLSTPLYVLVLRDPTEVAMSLQRRNRMPLDLGKTMWESYFRSALLHSADAPRVLVKHHDLLRDPVESIHHLASRLESMGVTGLRAADTTDWTSTVDPKRWRERALADAQTLTAEQRVLVSALESGDLPALPSLTPHSETTRRMLGVYREVSNELDISHELRPALRKSSRALQQMKGSVQAVQSRQAQLNRLKIEKLHKKVASLKAKVASYDTRLNNFRRSTSWRVTAPLRAAGRFMRRVKGNSE
jgi:hypothetical protein